MTAMGLWAEYTDGKWGQATSAEQPEADAMVTFCSAPPSCWLWWARGKMGVARSYDEACRAAESVLATGGES